MLENTVYVDTAAVKARTAAKINSAKERIKARKGKIVDAIPTPHAPFKIVKNPKK